MAATLRDVALAAGVSPRTVSNVVTGHAHVSDAVRYRVMAAVAQLDYRPDPVARALKSRAGQWMPLYLPPSGMVRSEDAAAALAAAAFDLGLRPDPPGAVPAAALVGLLLLRPGPAESGCF